MPSPTRPAAIPSWRLWQHYAPPRVERLQSPQGKEIENAREVIWTAVTRPPSRWCSEVRWGGPTRDRLACGRHRHHFWADAALPTADCPHPTEWQSASSRLKTTRGRGDRRIPHLPEGRTSRPTTASAHTPSRQCFRWPASEAAPVTTRSPSAPRRSRTPMQERRGWSDHRALCGVPRSRALLRT
jgi:hypothetical protein